MFLVMQVLEIPAGGFYHIYCFRLPIKYYLMHSLPIIKYSRPSTCIVHDR